MNWWKRTGRKHSVASWRLKTPGCDEGTPASSVPISRIVYSTNRVRVFPMLIYVYCTANLLILTYEVPQWRQFSDAASAANSARPWRCWPRPSHALWRSTADRWRRLPGISAQLMSGDRVNRQFSQSATYSLVCKSRITLTQAEGASQPVIAFLT